jgi:CDP-diacylglycerol--inositol 3-phosphatidyltransferase
MFKNPETQLSNITTKQIYLYIPNLIDYTRVVLNVIGFYYVKQYPNLFMFLYMTSYFLDDLDGIVARLLNQKSNFGAIIDMIIDRLATCGLLMVLSSFYPDWQFLFILLMMLDIGSHWLQTQSCIVVPDNENHKIFNEPFAILNTYYKNRTFMAIVCFGAEVSLMALYYMYFNPKLMDSVLFKCFISLNVPWYILKQYISVLQIISASERIANYDLQKLSPIMKESNLQPDEQISATAGADIRKTRIA